MTKVDFPYEEYGSVHVPNANLLGIYDLPEIHSEKTESEVLARALASPIGTATLRELAKGKKKILIASDDHHRPTPISRMLRPVLDELLSDGARKENIEIIMALGSHRQMTPDEIREKVGPEISSQYRVTNHDWQDAENLYYAGRVDPGIEVWVNRKVKEADLVLGLGRVMPIEVCGFTGGGKIVVPGLCGEKTNSDIHWVRVDIPEKEIIGRRDNPIREVIDRSALAAGLSAIFNVIVDARGRIAEAVFGDPVEAHRRGAEHALKTHGVYIPERADIVIADGCPFDIEFWQVNKALDTAGRVVKKGGVIIIVSPCHEGLSRTHEAVITKFGYRPKHEIKELVARGDIKHLVVGVHMIQVAEATLERGASCIVVTTGISEETLERVGLGYAPDAQSALERAFNRLGRRASVLVLRRAAEMLPIIGETS